MAESNQELHIVTVGNSLLSHYLLFKNESRKFHDHQFWSQFLDNPKQLDNLYSYLTLEPMRNSAEVNSITRYLMKHHMTPQQVRIFLLGTQTPSNEIVRNTLMRYLREEGFAFMDLPTHIPGYKSLQPELSDLETFAQGLSQMLEILLGLIEHGSHNHSRVLLNPTGSYKAHVMIMGLAAFITGSPLYYIHEEFSDIVEFPPVFYYPTKEELQTFTDFVFKTISPDQDNLPLKQWIDYGLIRQQFSENSSTKTRFELTPKGRIWLEFFKTRKG